MSSNLSQAINQPPIKLYRGASIIEPRRSCLPYELIEARIIARQQTLAVLSAFEPYDDPYYEVRRRNPYQHSDGRFDLYCEAALNELRDYRIATRRR